MNSNRTPSRDRHEAWSGGLLAGLLSLGALALRGRIELGSAAAPVNAPSHWLWGDEALRQRGVTWKHTAVGAVIHQASAFFWSALQRRINRGRPQPASVLRDAVVTTAIAATVDLALTPRRFTPGFERQLSPRGLVWVYGSFAAGFAVAALLARRR